jgi:hypothetical protein
MARLELSRKFLRLGVNLRWGQSFGPRFLPLFLPQDSTRCRPGEADRLETFQSEEVSGRIWLRGSPRAATRRRSSSAPTAALDRLEPFFGDSAADEPAPFVTSPPDSAPSEWASFNLGEPFLGPGNAASLMPILLIMLGGSAAILEGRKPSPVQFEKRLPDHPSQTASLFQRSMLHVRECEDTNAERCEEEGKPDHEHG